MTLSQFASKLISDIVSASFTLPVILLGKYAYKLKINQTLRDISTRSTLYRQICLDMVEERKKVILEGGKAKLSEKPSDIIHALLQSVPDSEVKDEKLLNEELLGELSNFLLAGSDTTSFLLQIMVFLLAENPEKEIKLRNIVNEVINSDTDITIDNFKRL